MSILSLLQQFGLSTKEARVYTAGLALGTTSIARLAARANLKRPTVYLVVEALSRKHLLVKIPKGQKIFYKPVSPEILKQRLREQTRNFSKILPQLKSLYKRSLREPKIRFYEGRDQLYKVYEELFKAKEIWAIFSANRFFEVFTSADNQHFFQILIRHGGYLYDLVEDTPKGRQLTQEKQRFGVSETKFLPKKFKLATDILATRNKVALISFQNITATLIEDQALATAQQQMIQYLWNSITHRGEENAGSTPS